MSWRVSSLPFPHFISPFIFYNCRKVTEQEKKHYDCGTLSPSDFPSTAAILRHFRREKGSRMMEEGLTPAMNQK